MIRTVRQSFAAGELAPELHMRSDLGAYQKGAQVMTNMYPRRTGSALQRPGTDAASLGSWEGSEGAFSAVPFYFDNARAYVLLLAVGNTRWFTLQPLFGFGGGFSSSTWSMFKARRVNSTGAFRENSAILSLKSRDMSIPLGS